MKIKLPPAPPIRSLWKNKARYGSPFRIFRCYSLRLRHPSLWLQRCTRAKILAKNISEEQQRRLSILKKEGCAPAGNDVDTGLLSQVCATLRERAKGVQCNMQIRDGKNFWEKLLTEEDKRSDSMFVRLALQPSVMSMVSAYLHEVPYLAHIEVLFSHGTQNPSWKESQLWHRDYDDRNMCKLFVYCTDVTSAEDGEFTYIPHHISKHVRNYFFPKRISDEEMDRQGYLQHKKHVFGPATTAFYINTNACYHLGSRVAVGHTRLAFTAMYVTYASLMPFNNMIHIVHKPNRIEQMVLRGS